MVEIACLSRLINANRYQSPKLNCLFGLLNQSLLQSKLDRVRQQVNQDLLQATLIRNTGSYIRREHEGQLQTPLLRPLSKQG